MDLAHHRRNGRTRRKLGVQIDVLCDGQWVTQDFFDSPTITVGRSRFNSLVLADDHAPRSLPLFHRQEDGYAIHYTEGTSGEVRRQPGAAPLDLSVPHFCSSAHADGYDLDLLEGAKGRVDVGDETLVFEVVVAPEPLSIPRNRSYWLVAPGLVMLALLSVPVWLPRVRTATAATTATAPKSQVLHPSPVAQPKIIPAPAIAARPPPPATSETPAAPRIVERSHVRHSRDVRTPPVRRASRHVAAHSGHSRTADWMPPQMVVLEIGRVQGAVTPHYAHALKDRPRLRGDLLVRLSVDGRGHVTSAMVVRDDLDAPEVRNRLLEVLRDWRTPRPVAEAAVYEIPFHFEPDLLRGSDAVL